MSRSFAIAMLLSFMAIVSKGQTTFQGKVRDDKGEPVEYFNLIILKSDSTLLDGQFCYDGFWSIKLDSIGDYIVKVECMGYLPKQNYINIDNLNYGTTIEYPDIILESNNFKIDEVSIVGRVPLVISKADRMTVRVSNSYLSETIDGIELLERTPGIHRDVNGGISVLGKGTPVIYIDERKLNSNSELNLINPNNVVSIDIIDNPSAIYSADGQAVIVINTRKNLKDKFAFNTGGTLIQGRRSSQTAYGDAWFNFNKFSVNAYLGINNRNKRTIEDNQRYKSSPLEFSSNSKNLSNSLKKNFKVSVDYKFNENNILTIQTDGFLSDYNSDRKQVTSFVDPSQSKFYTFSFIDKESYQINNTVYYLCKIDTLGQSLKAIADFTKMVNERNEIFTNTLGDKLLNDSFLNYNNSDGEAEIKSLRLDYSLPKSNIFDFKSGLKYSSIDGINNTKLSGSTNLNQSYRNNEQIFAAYIINKFIFSKKIDLELGIRSELTNREASNTNSKYLDESYFHLFPNLSLNYKSDELNIGFSYSKRISRPPFRMMDPTMVIDSLMNRQGNPRLKPSISHVNQLVYSPLRQLKLRLSYSYIVDPYYFLAFQDKNNPTVTKIRFENDKDTYSLSLSGFYELYITKSISFTINGTAWKNPYRYIEDGEERYNDKVNYYFSCRSKIVLPHKINFDLGIDYTGDGASGTIQPRRVYNLYLSFKKDFFNKKLNCSISANDILNTMTTYQKSVLEGNNINRYDADDTYVRLSLKYKFGKSDKKYKSKSATRTEKSRI